MYIYMKNHMFSYFCFANPYKFIGLSLFCVYRKQYYNQCVKWPRIIDTYNNFNAQKTHKMNAIKRKKCQCFDKHMLVLYLFRIVLYFRKKKNKSLLQLVWFSAHTIRTKRTNGEKRESTTKQITCKQQQCFLYNVKRQSW